MVNTSAATAAARHSGTGIRWGRVVLGALLLEVALLVVLVPVMFLIGSPFTDTAPEGDYTLFFTVVPVTLFAFAFAAGMWVARGVADRPLLHGLLAGIVATIMYVALAAMQPGGIGPVIAAYGTWLFVTSNGLRIVGAAAGAAVKRSR